MTLIEFFDTSPLENVCACLAEKPDEVIFLGSSRKKLEQKLRCIQDVLASRGYRPKLSLRVYKRNDLNGMIALLSELIEEMPDCAFDLTGGEELLLVAFGIVWERYRSRGVRANRMDLPNRRVLDCDGDGELIPPYVPSLTVDELVALGCGHARCDGRRLRELDEAAREEITALWQVCREEPHDWNELTAVLATLFSANEEKRDPLLLSRRVDMLPHHKGVAALDMLEDGLMQALCRSGLVSRLSARGEAQLKLRFRSRLVRECLTKAGSILEYKLMASAAALQDDDGRPLYDDIQTGVWLDWDDDPMVDVPNEIDVCLMRGCIPVFVSCKNGGVTVDELYKLQTVAERFGGVYAKKALFVSNLQRLSTGAARQLRLRAARMGIRLLGDVQSMSEEELARVLHSLWRD